MAQVKLTALTNYNKSYKIINDEYIAALSANQSHNCIGGYSQIIDAGEHIQSSVKMTKDNFYIITGGPGGGKTSLLEFVAAKGFVYIPETAREIIRERLSKGLSVQFNI